MQTILKNLGKENTSELTSTRDFRLKNVQTDTDIHVDITFTEKTDKLSYSTKQQEVLLKHQKGRASWNLNPAIKYGILEIII